MKEIRLKLQHYGHTKDSGHFLYLTLLVMINLTYAITENSLHSVVTEPFKMSRSKGF